MAARSLYTCARATYALPPPTSSPNSARVAGGCSASTESRAPPPALALELTLILRVADEADSEMDDGALGGAEIDGTDGSHTNRHENRVLRRCFS